MRSNYNIITMKKLVYLLAVGSLAFTACNNSPAYKVSGTVEGLADGDTIYLQEYRLSCNSWGLIFVNFPLCIHLC